MKFSRRFLFSDDCNDIDNGWVVELDTQLNDVELAEFISEHVANSEDHLAGAVAWVEVDEDSEWVCSPTCL